METSEKAIEYEREKKSFDATHKKREEIEQN